MESVRAARDAYLAENGFTVASYTEKWGYGSFFGFKFPVLNTPGRARAIAQHDLHHVATGFGTDYAGEGEISAWEVAAGLPPSAYVSAIILSGMLVGFLVAPRRALRAFSAGRHARSLFGGDAACYEALLAMSLGELRRHVGVPQEGLATSPARLHSAAPSGVSPRGVAVRH